MTRVAFLGTGGIARTHAAALNRGGGCQITASCAATVEEAAAFNQFLAPEAEAHASFEEMLDKGGFEALYVCLPPFAHEGQEEMAAARGIHLFLEKPIALTLERAESIVRAVEESGVVSHVGFHMRFSGPVRRLKELVDQGRAGQSMLFSADYLCSALHAPWWRSVDKSGGQLVEQAIHLYDLAAWLFGEPESVSAAIEKLGHKDVEGYTVEDTSAATIRFESGAIGSIRASNAAVPMEWRSPWRVVFEGLTAELLGDGSAQVWHTQGRGAEYYWSSGAQVPTEAVPAGADPYVEQAAHFLECVRTGQPALTPARVGLERLKLVLAAKRSGQEGGRVVALSEMGA